MMERRWEYAYEGHELPGRFWEPEPDEEDMKRQEAEYMERLKTVWSQWRMGSFPSTEGRLFR